MEERAAVKAAVVMAAVVMAAMVMALVAAMQACTHIQALSSNSLHSSYSHQPRPT